MRSLILQNYKLILLPGKIIVVFLCSQDKRQLNIIHEQIYMWPIKQTANQQK